MLANSIPHRYLHNSVSQSIQFDLIEQRRDNAISTQLQRKKEKEKRLDRDMLSMSYENDKKSVFGL